MDNVFLLVIMLTLLVIASAEADPTDREGPISLKTKVAMPIFVSIAMAKNGIEVKECDCSMNEIAKLANIGENYHTDINKGIRPAKYVKLNVMSYVMAKTCKSFA
jgi:hypothetical protein